MSKDKNYLTLDNLNNIKMTFLKRKEEILRSNNVQEIDIDGGDEIDVVQGTVIKSVADSLSLREAQALENIQAALSRIEQGTFGYCESCEEFISYKRLLAVPECKECISCAEENERIAKQYYNKVIKISVEDE